MCVSKKDLAFYPKMWLGGETQLVKLSNSSISMGKYVRSKLALFCRFCLCVCTCVSVCVYHLFSKVCVFFSARVLSAGLLGRTFVRFQSHGFSRWSEELVKQSMRGWCHSSNRRGVFVTLLMKERLDTQMNLVWGFAEKSYGSSSCRQIHWPVLVHTKPHLSACLFWCFPFPRSQTKGNISTAIKVSLGSLWVAVMFLVSCYYTVSSFRRSTDASSKNLHCNRRTDAVSLTL